MAKLTDFLGKKTVDIISCKEVGVVLFGVFNGRIKKLTHLVTSEGYVACVKHAKITENHILSGKTEEKTDDIRINLDTPLLTLDGEKLTLTDIVLDKNMNVLEIITTTKTFTKNEVYNASSNLVLLQGKKYKKPQPIKKVTDKVTLIYPVEKKPINIAPLNNVKDLTYKMPKKVTFTSVVPIKKASEQTVTIKI